MLTLVLSPSMLEREMSLVTETSALLYLFSGVCSVCSVCSGVSIHIAWISHCAETLTPIGVKHVSSEYIVGFSGRQSIWMLSERRWLLSDKFAALGSALYLRAPAMSSHWLRKAKANIFSANGIAEICKGFSHVQVSYMAMSS